MEAEFDLDGYLPQNASFSADGGLQWSGQYIGNFIPILCGLVESESEDDSELLARVRLIFTDDSKSKEFTLPISDLADVNWFSLDTRCLLNPDCARAGRYLAHIIHSAIPAASVVKEHHISRLGTHTINDIPGFNMGDQIIWHPNAKTPCVVIEPTPYKLAIGDYSEREALVGMLKVVKLSFDAGRAIFAQSLVYVMRSVFISAGIIPCCILFLVGKSGGKKTTYASFMTQLYNRDNGIARPTRLNASIPAAVEILSTMSDCVVVMDDLCPAEANDIKKHQEKTLFEITRIIADSSGRARMNGAKVTQKTITSGLLLTGEYNVGAGSDAARLLPISLTSPIDNVKLSECQREPLIVSSFFRYFIEWYIENYFQIRDLLTRWLTNFRRVDLGVHGRLHETFFCLNSAYKLFLTYCAEGMYILPEEAQKQQRSFQNLLVSLVKEQQKRVDQDKSSETGKVDYTALIYTLYKRNAFHLAKSIDKFKDHDGLLHNDLLCLRGENLLSHVQKIAPSASLSEVRHALIAKDALWLDGEGKNKKVGRRRFYAIDLKKLK